ncbi:MAG TPA: isochorismatase family protein [Pseudolabrys sp.]|nr:isochorismatase family protein [Pseudolabrys sp.]
MPVTQLDPDTALIVIDLQKGIMSFPTVHPIETVLDNAAALADAFRRRGLPIVLVNVDGVAPGRAEAQRHLGDLPPDWTALAPELKRQPQDHVVTKRTWGAFTGTDLETYLKSRGITQVVVAGVATSAGVESTARHAHELGFNVTLAVDVMTDTAPEAHDNSVKFIFPIIGETGTTQAIIALLANETA